MKTKVKFLVNENDLCGFFPDIFAFFPEEVADTKGNFTSYSHIGQHSACCIEYAEESRLATEEEYKNLKNELEQIGYELEILN